MTSMATISVMVIIIFNTINLKSGIAEVEISWKNYSDKAISQLESLSTLREHMGYGGLIHSFKNYLLRKDVTYADRAAYSIELIYHELDNLKQQQLNDKSFQYQILKVRSVIDKYRANLRLLRLQPISTPVSELDKIVSIDDSQALKAIEILATNIKNDFEIKKENSEQHILEIKNRASLAFLSSLIILVIATGLMWMIWRGEQSNRIIKIERKKAEKSAETKTAILATMSHEIRTPLTAILGIAELLRSTKVDKEQEKQIDLILSSGQHLSSILNDILDISKLTANKAELVPTSFKIDQLAEMIVSMYSPIAQGKGLELKIHIDAAIKGFLLSGDLHKIRQILFNLVGNAIKFTDEGSVALTINKKNETPNDLTLVISVIDTGIGIPSHQLEYIFDEFAQAEDYKEKSHQGTGLGLAICKRLTKLMGGHIYATSEIGEGTTFNCEIFLQKEKIPELKNSTLTKNSEATPQKTLKPLKVLVVDDTEINRMIVSAHLKNSFVPNQHIQYF